LKPERKPISIEAVIDAQPVLQFSVIAIAAGSIYFLFGQKYDLLIFRKLFPYEGRVTRERGGEEGGRLSLSPGSSLLLWLTARLV
jgi:hypothetical protein